MPAARPAHFRISQMQARGADCYHGLLADQEVLRPADPEAYHAGGGHCCQPPELLSAEGSPGWGRCCRLYCCAGSAGEETAAGAGRGSVGWHVRHPEPRHGQPGLAAAVAAAGARLGLRRRPGAALLQATELLLVLWLRPWREVAAEGWTAAARAEGLAGQAEAVQLGGLRGSWGPGEVAGGVGDGAGRAAGVLLGSGVGLGARTGAISRSKPASLAAMLPMVPSASRRLPSSTARILELGMPVGRKMGLKSGSSSVGQFSIQCPGCWHLWQR